MNPTFVLRLNPILLFLLTLTLYPHLHIALGILYF
jgi:hypothetical protein